MEHLSHEDAKALLQEAASPEDAALRLSRSFDDDGLTAEERTIAGALLNRLLFDASLKLRSIIAETVKSSAGLPHDVAMRLALDEDSVAVSMLEHSPVLSDEDLIKIIQSDAPEKQTAIARRASVGESVVNELILTDNDRAVSTLLENKGAAIKERHLETVAARFGNVPSVVAVLTKHPKLTTHLAERLRDFTTVTLINYLKRNPDLPNEAITQLVLKTREELPQTLREDSTEADDVSAIVNHLANRRQLSPQLILRALCTGDIDLFEAAMAKRADIPLINAQKLLHDAGPHGLKPLYDKAGLPQKLLPAIETSLDMLHTMQIEGQPFDIGRYHHAIVERVLTRYPDLDPADVDYLLIRLAP